MVMTCVHCVNVFESNENDNCLQNAYLGIPKPQAAVTQLLVNPMNKLLWEASNRTVASFSLFLQMIIHVQFMYDFIIINIVIIASVFVFQEMHEELAKCHCQIMKQCTD
jgi:hypothetical protein